MPVTCGEYMTEEDVGDGRDVDGVIVADVKGWERRIWRRVRSTSCGYVARDATIFEEAEQMRMLDAGRVLESSSRSSGTSAIETSWRRRCERTYEPMIWLSRTRGIALRRD